MAAKRTVSGKSTSASAAGISRRGAACSIRRGSRRRRSWTTPSSHLTSIEINATFYGSQKPESFRKWAATVPDGFVFSVKGPRFATNRRVLAEAGDSIKRFINSGVLELRDRLGPMLWQFAPTKKFDAADFGKFLELLPREAGGQSLRHVVEVRHAELSHGGFRRADAPFRAPRRVHRPRRPILRSPTCRATSSMRGCKRGRTRYRLPIRRRNSTPGLRRLRTWASGQMPDDLPHVDRGS